MRRGIILGGWCRRWRGSKKEKGEGDGGLFRILDKAR